MSDPSITYFPVGNGDTSMIRLSDGTNVLIDCNVTSDSRDGSVKTRYDVHAHLLKELRKDEKGIPHAGASRTPLSSRTRTTTTAVGSRTRSTPGTQRSTGTRTRSSA